jgi:hypothetical protein
MSDNTLAFLLTFMWIGWIPILAIGKAISWIVLAVKNKNNKTEQELQN